MTGARATVLLVEDDAAFRRSVAAYLEDSGLTVVEAEDGVAALALLAELRPDVIITDLRMPRMGGAELLETLKARAMTVPVIMVSGTADRVFLAETAAGGAAGYLTKPIVDLGVLEALVRSVLLEAAI